MGMDGLKIPVGGMLVNISVSCTGTFIIYGVSQKVSFLSVA